LRVAVAQCAIDQPDGSSSDSALSLAERLLSRQLAAVRQVRAQRGGCPSEDEILVDSLKLAVPLGAMQGFPWTTELVRILFEVIVCNQSHLTSDAENRRKTRSDFFEHRSMATPLLQHLQLHNCGAVQACIEERFRFTLRQVMQQIESGLAVHLLVDRDMQDLVELVQHIVRDKNKIEASNRNIMRLSMLS
jgi:hypothetical protein